MFEQEKMGVKFEGVPTSRFPRYTGKQAPRPDLWREGTPQTPGTPQQPTAMDTSESDHNPGSACGLPVCPSSYVPACPSRPKFWPFLAPAAAYLPPRVTMVHDVRAGDVVCGVWCVAYCIAHNTTASASSSPRLPYARCSGWGRSGRERTGNMKPEHVWSDVVITKEPCHRGAGLHITTCWLDTVGFRRVLLECLSASHLVIPPPPLDMFSKAARQPREKSHSCRPCYGRLFPGVQGAASCHVPGCLRKERVFRCIQALDSNWPIGALRPGNAITRIRTRDYLIFSRRETSNGEDQHRRHSRHHLDYGQSIFTCAAGPAD